VMQPEPGGEIRTLFPAHDEWRISLASPRLPLHF
jgi:hypothetical protein